MADATGQVIGMVPVVASVGILNQTMKMVKLPKYSHKKKR
jgi:hypothetical protein